MKKWDPYPFKDQGKIFAGYIKKRFNTPSGIAKDVPDDFVLNLVKGVTDTKLQAELIKSAEGGRPPYPIPEELNKWAKEVVRILLKKGIMKHGDLLSELESIKSYNCTYLHISQLFQNAFSKKFLKKEITNKNSYYSLTDPDKYTL